MKKSWLVFMLALVLLAPSLAAAADAVKVAVFPFHVFSRQPMDELRTGVAEMLMTRLKNQGLAVLNADDVQRALKASDKPLDLTVARQIAGRLGADYAVIGSLTMIGNRVSLDGRVLDVLGMQRPQSVYVEGVGLDALPNLTDRLAREVAVRATGREKVADVKVEGNRRIESEAVKAVMKSKAGGPFSPILLDEDLRAVWKMGYFDDVRMKTADTPDGKVVTVMVKEKPMIREVTINGNKAVDSKDIQDQIGIKPFSVYKPGEFKEAELKIIKLYHDKGYYDAKVTSQVVDLPSGDKGVKFDITEGDKVFVSKIEFTGNKAFDAGELRDQMTTGEKGWLSWLTENNVLERNTLDQDLQKITDFYYNHGYMTAKAGNPDIKRGPDGLIITIPIVEGPRFKVASVGVTGELIIPQKDIMANLKLKAGEWFNRDNMRQDLAGLHDLYADRGYAYVDVRPQVKQDMEKETVAIMFDIKKGDVIYFERIVITGNTRTRDKVIRRELGVAEGDKFSSTALRNANMRLHRLNYFEDIHITTTKGTDPEKMDLKVDVKEKRTGQISFGTGYSTEDSFMIMGQISESNLFGRGQKLELRGQLGGKSTRYTISFTEPWLFDRPISAGVDLYDWYREYTDYDKEAVGGRLRFGFPSPWAFTRFYAYYTYEVAHIGSVGDNVSRLIKDQEGDHTTSSIRGIVRRDSRDHLFNTTHGSDNSLSVEYAGGPLGGTNAYIKVIGDSAWYFPLFWKTVFVVHGRAGWLTGHSGGDLPIYERFFLGGINTLRGFDYQSVGPKDDGDVIGGERMAMANIEYRFPLLPQAGVVGLVFYDTGNAWTADQGYDLGDLRSSTGAGIRWFSPVGPLRLEYGFVLDPKEGESTSNWEFSVGSVF